MDIGNLTRNIVKKARDTTLDYRPSPASLKNNRNQAYVSLATGGVLKMMTDLDTMAAVVMMYGALKGYHAVRDWANK